MLIPPSLPAEVLCFSAGSNQGPVTKAKEAITGNSSGSRDTSGVNRGTSGISRGTGGEPLNYHV